MARVRKWPTPRGGRRPGVLPTRRGGVSRAAVRAGGRSPGGSEPPPGGRRFTRGGRLPTRCLRRGRLRRAAAEFLGLVDSDQL